MPDSEAEETQQTQQTQQEDEGSVGELYCELMDQVEALLELLENTETALHRLQRPMEQLSLQQLGDVPFLQTSPFRFQEFMLKKRPGKRIPFHILCKELCSHSLSESHDILTSPFLKEQLDISANTLTYPQLLGTLVNGIV